MVSLRKTSSSRPLGSRARSSAGVPLATISPRALMMARVQTGDEAAFGALMERWERPVKSVIARLVFNVTEADELALEEKFYAVQVKQKDKAGRPDIDAFETALRRAKCEKGFFVSFDYSSDALREIDRFFREEHRIIIPLTVREILDEEIARKLA